MTSCDLPDCEVWEHFGFTEEDARAWVGAASYRFTPTPPGHGRPRASAPARLPRGPRHSSIHVSRTPGGRPHTVPSTPATSRTEART
jgi:hypothetical protein